MLYYGYIDVPRPKQLKNLMQNLILDNPSTVDRWHYPVYTKDKIYSCFRIQPHMTLISYDHVVKDTIEYSQEHHLEFTNVNTSLDNYIETVIDKIYQSVKNKKCWIADTNGLDCNVIIAVMNYFSIDYQIYSYNGNRDKHPQWYRNIQDCHWGFNQTPYFNEPVDLATGMYGDEYMLRNPFYVEQHLKIDVDKEFENYPNSYMYDFYKQSYSKKMNKEYNKDWLQILLNDYQLWSFHHVNVINPFKNKNILLKGLSLDQDTIIKQLTDGFISKEIIKRTDPKRLDNVHKFKNIGDDPRFSVYYN